MPTICYFRGITIEMFPKDHPAPHFHAYYAEYEAKFLLDGTPFEGRLPRRQERLVKEWAAQRVEELKEDWELAQARRPLRHIAPLS
jgi:hypothetical protein